MLIARHVPYKSPALLGLGRVQERPETHGDYPARQWQGKTDGGSGEGAAASRAAAKLRGRTPFFLDADFKELIRARGAL